MLEIIGAGFGRTGTHSLGLALEKLGVERLQSRPCQKRNKQHESSTNTGTHI